MNILEKKPIKGGTPAIENSDTVKKNRWCESKPKLENEYKVFMLEVILEVSIQNSSINVILQINMQVKSKELLV